MLELRRLQIEDIAVDVLRKRIRHLYISVDRQTAGVRVSAPVRLHEDTVRAALVTRLPWIRRQLARAAARLDQTILDAAGGTPRRELDASDRRRLKSLIPSLLAQWEPVVGVRAAEWRIKRMKTKWGTCNIRARRIWLNLELARRPVRSIEYILVHELVHLHERHHNARFKVLMDQFMPDWRARRRELAGPVKSEEGSGKAK